MFGFYLSYDLDLPQTGFLQCSSDDTKMWGKPEVPADAAKYTTWPRRIRVLRDGRVVLLAGVARLRPAARRGTLSARLWNRRSLCYSVYPESGGKSFVRILLNHNDFLTVR